MYNDRIILITLGIVLGFILLMNDIFVNLMMDRLETLIPCPYHYLTYIYNIMFFILGYIFNIIYGSNKWYLTEIEDMYMIVLNDIFNSKVILLEKTRNFKTQRFEYNLNTYTLMKRVKITLTDNVKSVINFIKEDL